MHDLKQRLVHYLSSFEATAQYKYQLEQSSCGYLEIKASNKYIEMRAKCLYMSDYSTNNKLLFNTNDVKFYWTTYYLIIMQKLALL